MRQQIIAIGVAVAATLCAGPAVPAHPAPDAPTADLSAPAAREILRMTFDYVSGPDGEPVEEIRVAGLAQVTADVAAHGGGQLVAATSRPAQGRAVSFPAFDPVAGAPRAVVRVTPQDGEARLSPRGRDFTFGADFVLDAESSQPGTTDDGDNLVQRGLYDDPQQYKLQLDDRRPSCRLKGRVDGRPAVLEVIARERVDAAHWYGADCQRVGTSLTVVVKRFNDDGSTTTTTRTAHSAEPIRIKMKSEAVPFSVGGKLGTDGSVQLDSDQFNGVVDNVFLEVG